MWKQEEQKFLKCVEALWASLIEQRLYSILSLTDHNTEEFRVETDMAGELCFSNVELLLKGKKYTMYCRLNSEKEYPIFLDTDDRTVIYILDDRGEFTHEFIKFIVRPGDYL